MKRINTKFIFICFLVFLFLFPLSNSIFFMQNDDWVHYQQVSTFLSGDWKLDPYLGPTFYTQGFLGAVFSLVFGSSKLPVLTLFFSVSILFIIFNILFVHYKKSTSEAILLGLLFFVVPLNLYSTLGFMTEIYLLFFILVSYSLFLRYDKEKTTRNLIFLYLVILITLLLKQIALVFPLTLVVYYLTNKNTKEASKHMLGFLFLLFFSFLYFLKLRLCKPSHSLSTTFLKSTIFLHW